MALAHTSQAYRDCSPSSSTASSSAPTIGECVVCVDEAATLAAMPCGHLCLCATCAAGLVRDGSTPRCPICRSELSRTQRIYVATSKLSSAGSKRPRPGA